MIKILFIFCLLNFSLFSQEKPNVILILADDLAFGDLSCNGGDRMKTPNIDKMAAEGIRFTSYYSGNSVCTPSRMALLTGSYPARLGWNGGVSGYGMNLTNGLAPEAYTMAEMFKDAGYQTAISGKWHIGTKETMLPNQQGFDSAYFLAMSNNQTKTIFRDDKVAENPFENRFLSEKITKEAIRFIGENKDKPFFLYLPYTAPHFPVEAHPDWRGKSKNEAFGDVVEELDFRIGEIMDYLNKNGLEEKTIVVFTSDNGTEGGQKKWSQVKPFRGLKWSSLEGGSRVPFILKFPQKIQKNQVSDKFIATIDLLPTLAAACNIQLKMPEKSQKLDGLDVWQSLLGKAEHPRENLLFWDGKGNPQAIRLGDFKLYFDDVKDIARSDERMILVNLKDDPQELTDISESYPDKVKEMSALAQKILLEIPQNNLPLGGPAVEAQPPKQPKWLK